MSGALKDLSIDGHSFAITTDTDISFVSGGTAVTESQSTSKGAHRITDSLIGKVAGSTGQWDLGSVDYLKFEELRTRSTTEKFSASFTTAEGFKVNTATAYIVLSGAADGVFTTREGKTEFEIHADSWSTPKKI